MTDNGLDYEWIDGLLYPKLEVKDSDRLKNLDKFGKARLHYLHKQKFEYYKELFYSGKLAEHYEEVAERAFQRSEQVQEQYIERHPLPQEDFFERVAIRTMAKMIGDEIAMEEIVSV
ncbi:MAG: TnpV protein [Lachnospiraceae bacterium]